MQRNRNTYEELPEKEQIPYSETDSTHQFDALMKAFSVILVIRMAECSLIIPIFLFRL